MKKIDLFIVGAGMSGKLAAKVSGRGCRIFEMSSAGQQRSARMVGTNYLHEDVPEMVTERIEVVTGKLIFRGNCSDPEGYRIPCPIDSPIEMHTDDFEKYWRFTKSWMTETESAKDRLISERTSKRYAHRKVAWSFSEPETDDLTEWDSVAYSVSPREKRVRIIHGKNETEEYEYDKLVWTAPLPSLVSAIGLDPRSLRLQQRAIYYRAVFLREEEYSAEERRMAEALRTPQTAGCSQSIYVYYNTYEGCPLYRTTLYLCKGGMQVAMESMAPLAGFASFLPGKIKGSPLADAFCEILRGHDIFPSGRFATWNPEELMHHTVRRLREDLS